MLPKLHRATFVFVFQNSTEHYKKKKEKIKSNHKKQKVLIKMLLWNKTKQYLNK